MFQTIVLGLLLLLALFIFIVGPTVPDGNSREGKRTSLRALGFVPLVLFIVWGLLACTTQISARNEGVLVTFGKANERTLDPGLALKAPWQGVVEIDGSNKGDTFNGSKSEDTDDDVYHGPINVRLGDGNVATAYVYLQWSSAPGEANRIYSQYRSDKPITKLRDNLVVPLFRDAVNAALGTYSPTKSIDTLNIDFTDPTAAASALENLDLSPDFAALSDSLKTEFNKRISAEGDPLITVKAVGVTYLSFSKKTQGKIDDFLDEASKTRVALQSQATNSAQAAANKLLSDSISNDPNVLVAQCYDLIKDGKLKPPAGFSCWPGGSSSVVLPAAK